MSTMPIAHVYDLYLASTNEPAISSDEFSTFWSSLGDAERDWWINAFQTKTAVLTRELLELQCAFDATDRDKPDPELLSRLKVLKNRH